MSYFFDTYAILEIIIGNPMYERFSSNVQFYTTKLNLMELYYSLLSQFGIEVAEKYFEKFNENCITFDDSDIKEAVMFRHQNKKFNLSYIDCLGYIIALKRNLIFLTGDKQFEKLQNVEFVK